MQKRQRGPTPLSDAIQVFLRETGLGARPRDARVFAAWERALGERLAGRTRAVAFRGGELVVEVGSSALYQELRNFTGERFRHRANDDLGADRIRRVVFKLRG